MDERRERRRGYFQTAAFAALLPFSAAAFWALSTKLPAYAPPASQEVATPIATIYTPDTEAGYAVKIKAPNGQWGSGVHIGNGRFLTNAHVVRDHPSLTVITDDGKERDAEILWANEPRDVAIISIEGPSHISSIDIDCREPAVGEHVTIYGNPEGLDFLEFDGRVAGVSRPFSGKLSVNPIDARIVPGTSGGPVVDAAGKLVGLNVMFHKSMVQGAPMYPPSTSYTGISFIIPSSTICPLLGRS